MKIEMKDEERKGEAIKAQQWPATHRMPPPPNSCSTSFRREKYQLPANDRTNEWRIQKARVARAPHTTSESVWTEKKRKWTHSTRNELRRACALCSVKTNPTTLFSVSVDLITSKETECLRQRHASSDETSHRRYRAAARPRSRIWKAWVRFYSFDGPHSRPSWFRCATHTEL